MEIWRSFDKNKLGHFFLAHPVLVAVAPLTDRYALIALLKFSYTWRVWTTIGSMVVCSWKRGCSVSGSRCRSAPCSARPGAFTPYSPTSSSIRRSVIRLCWLCEQKIISQLYGKLFRKFVLHSLSRSSQSTDLLDLVVYWWVTHAAYWTKRKALITCHTN